MSKPASPQDHSPLFATLPLEIRRNVYQQLWLDCGLTQHIFAIRKKWYLMSFPCILSADLNREPRHLSHHADAGADDSEPPNNTPWCAHFTCFRNKTEKWGHSFARMYSAFYRGSRVQPDLRNSTVLTTFLVCKGMYQEASESLFSKIRFSFTTMLAMEVFLSEVPPALVSRIQVVDVGVLVHLCTMRPSSLVCEDINR